MTAGAQATFVVEYPCDQFCRVEIELLGERGQLTLQQMWEKADGVHRRIHEPDGAEPTEPVADEGAAQHPAADLFRSAPARGDDRRRETSAHPRR